LLLSPFIFFLFLLLLLPILVFSFFCISIRESGCVLKTILNNNHSESKYLLQFLRNFLSFFEDNKDKKMFPKDKKDVCSKDKRLKEIGKNILKKNWNFRVDFFNTFRSGFPNR
jgi:hypothetical protein